MGFCNQCGATIENGQSFCPSCGKPAGQNGQGQYGQGQNAQGQYGQGQYGEGQNSQGQNAQGQYSQGQNSQGQYTQGQYGQGQQFGSTLQPDHTSDFDPRDINANKGMAVLSYIGILFLIPLLAAPNSRFARFHASQGLNLCLVLLGTSFISTVLTTVIRVPHTNGLWTYSTTPWFISLISFFLGLAVLALIIIGIVGAVQGKAKELPLIGRFKLIK